MILKTALFGDDLVERAFDLVQPAILVAMESRLFKRKHLHIVVLDPVVTEAGIGGLWSVNEDRVRQAIAGKRDFRDGTPWSHPYDEFARAKAWLSWYTRMSSREVRDKPWMFHNGAIQYGGSVYRDGLIVAASGVQPWFDEMAADWVASAIMGLVRDAANRILAIPDAHYVTQDGVGG